MVCSGNVARHPEKDCLGSQLERPQSNFLEPSFASLLVDYVLGEGFVGLESKESVT